MCFWLICLTYCITSLRDVSSETDDADMASLQVLQMISSNQSELIKTLHISQALDVCFLVDLTWSIEPYLHEIKHWIGDLVMQLSEDTSFQNRSNLRLSFVGYRDVEDNIPFEILHFVSNTSEFDRFVSDTKTQGGGDVPENIFGALLKVSNLEWNSLSQKVMFHFTDSPCCHEMCGVETNSKCENISDLDSIITSVKDKNIKYFFGQISNLTREMILSFQHIYGLNISLFDLGFKDPSYSANNIEHKSFVTANDLQNAEKLKQQLKNEAAAGDKSGALEKSWSENLLDGDIDLRGLPIESLVNSINGQPVSSLILSDASELDNALADTLKLWPDGIIAYTLSNRFTERQRAMIALSIESIHTSTCIRWLAHRGFENDYVSFEMGPVSPVVCRSSVGRVTKIQVITLSQDCFGEIGVVMHEMMHTIGFLHEQSRSDRDGYVKILWKNLPNGEENPNFSTYGVDIIDNLDTNYDYSSIMHYPRFIEGIEVVVPLINVKIGQREKFSETDIYKIKKLYNCLENDKPVCDTNIDCVERSQKGECLTNSVHMLSECYKYCLLCHKVPVTLTEVQPSQSEMFELDHVLVYVHPARCATNFLALDNFDHNPEGIRKCANECIKHPLCTRFTISKEFRQCYLVRFNNAEEQCNFFSSINWTSGIVITKELSPLVEIHEGRSCSGQADNYTFATTQVRGCSAACHLLTDCHHFTFHNPTNVCYLFRERGYANCVDGGGADWTAGTIQRDQILRKAIFKSNEESYFKCPDETIVNINFASASECEWDTCPSLEKRKELAVQKYRYYKQKCDGLYQCQLGLDPLPYFAGNLEGFCFEPSSQFSNIIWPSEQNRNCVTSDNVGIPTNNYLLSLSSKGIQRRSRRQAVDLINVKCQFKILRGLAIDKLGFAEFYRKRKLPQHGALVYEELLTNSSTVGFVADSFSIIAHDQVEISLMKKIRFLSEKFSDPISAIYLWTEYSHSLISLHLLRRIVYSEFRQAHPNLANSHVIVGFNRYSFELPHQVARERFRSGIQEAGIENDMGVSFLQVPFGENQQDGATEELPDLVFGGSEISKID